MNKLPFHWHTGCSRCRQLIYVAAGDGDPPVPKTHPMHSLCPYCLHADNYPPERLILHTGYGTIYHPPERNLTDTTLLVAGFIAAIRLSREKDLRTNDPRMLSATSDAMMIAGAIVRNAASQ